jgi:site-specific recombinase XerD
MNPQDTRQQSSPTDLSHLSPTARLLWSPARTRSRPSSLLEEGGSPRSDTSADLRGDAAAAGLLSECIGEYMDDCYGLSPNTQTLYATHLRRLLVTVGDRPIAGVDSRVIRHFMGHLRRYDGGEYSAAYLDQVYRTLHTFFEWLVREGALAENPMARVRRVKVPKRKSPRLTLNEIERLLDAVKSTRHAERNLALVCLMMDSGLRRGEVVGLGIRDVDLQGRFVRVFGKDREERDVPLGEDTTRILQAYLAVRPASTSPKLFLKLNGKPLQGDGVHSLVYRLKDTAGLPQLCSHLLRHTFANHYIAEGGSLRKLQKTLGHNDVTTTADIYTDPELVELQREHTRVSPLAQLGRARGRRCQGNEA